MTVALKMMATATVIKTSRYEIWNDMAPRRFWPSGTSS